MHLLPAVLMGAAGVGPLHAGEEVIILSKGKTDTLAEWDKPVHFGTGNWKVVDDAEDQAIKLRAESSSFALEKSITVDLSRTPFLEWEWKVTVPPAGGNFSSPDTDDQAAQLLVVFPKTFFERRKIISYIWDPTAPKGAIASAAGPVYLNVQAIVVESGDDRIGHWIIEKRNVVDDFRALYGEIPEHAVAIRLQINSQHTQSVAFATTAQAEWYVGAYGGLSYPGAFSNVTLSDPALGGGISGARINDLELKTTLVGSVKAGYFFVDRPWLGLETEVFTLTPDVKLQDVVGGKAGGPVFVDTIAEIPLRLTTWAANVVIRSPSLSDVFQPYGGMGYALFLANSSQAGESNIHITHGFNMFAGARYALTEKWCLFEEFKYNRTTLRFSNIRGDYGAQTFVFGVMWRFDK